MNIKERFDRLDRMIADGNVIRHQWAAGKERACLLAALSPEAGEQETSTACPVNVLPAWFARLTPSMNDNGTPEAWPAFVLRYAKVVRLAALTLDADGWKRAEYRVRRLAVIEACKYTSEQSVLDACERVVGLCSRQIANDFPSESEWAEARAVAWAAEAEARAAAAAAAAAAAWTAAAAARASASVAVWTAAEAASWDRMNTGILDALEIEIAAALAARETK